MHAPMVRTSDPAGPGGVADVRAVVTVPHSHQHCPMDIDFVGFVGDCLVTGRLDLRADRLTDHLNAEGRVTLHDVVLEGLDGGRVETDSFTIERSQLCAVLGSGPRGAEVLRVPTDARRLQAQIGPYMVLGRYHGPVGGTNLSTFSERDPMVPLTDATIAYVVNGILEVRDAMVVIVNRELAAWYHDTDEPRTGDDGTADPARRRERSAPPHWRDVPAELTIPSGERRR